MESFYLILILLLFNKYLKINKFKFIDFRNNKIKILYNIILLNIYKNWYQIIRYLWNSFIIFKQVVNLNLIKSDNKNVINI